MDELQLALTRMWHEFALLWTTLRFHLLPGLLVGAAVATLVSFGYAIERKRQKKTEGRRRPF